MEHLSEKARLKLGLGKDGSTRIMIPWVLAKALPIVVVGTLLLSTLLAAMGGSSSPGMMMPQSMYNRMQGMSEVSQPSRFTHSGPEAVIGAHNVMQHNPAPHHAPHADDGTPDAAAAHGGSDSLASVAPANDGSPDAAAPLGPLPQPDSAGAADAGGVENIDEPPASEGSETNNVVDDVSDRSTDSDANSLSQDGAAAAVSDTNNGVANVVADDVSNNDGGDSDGELPPLDGVQQWDQCLAEIAARPIVCPKEDWKEWNNKPETVQLVKDYKGGLTPLMHQFMKIYEDQLWTCGSGLGSNVAYAQRTICLLSDVLPDLLNVDLLIDLPCGDQQWMPLLRERLPKNIKYLGVDAMPGLIQRNIEMFGDERTEFMLGEMDDPDCFESIRERSKLWKPTDRVAVLSRHVLQHNSYPAIFQYLQGLKNSGVTYFIGTWHYGVPANPPSEMAFAGAFSQFDFHQPPFNFPHGILEWLETPREKDGMYASYHRAGILEMMSVWDVSSLPETYSLEDFENQQRAAQQQTEFQRQLHLAHIQQQQAQQQMSG